MNIEEAKSISVEDISRDCSCRLVHHGAAAAVSGNQVVTWITNASTSNFVYASNAVLNITNSITLVNPSNIENGSSNRNDSEQVSPTTLRRVQETLRCTVLEEAPTISTSPIVITCVVSAKGLSDGPTGFSATLVSGFTNGMIQVWLCHENRWTEHTITLTNNDPQPSRSITSLDAIWFSTNTGYSLQIAVGTSAGMAWYECRVHNNSTKEIDTTNHNVKNNQVIELITSSILLTKLCGAVASLQYTLISLQHRCSIALLFVGTAAPRHNKIHVFQCNIGTATSMDSVSAATVQYCGPLSGHEDWVTSLSCSKNDNDSFLLASGSQDARIRIWKFRTTVADLETDIKLDENVVTLEPKNNENDLIIDEAENESNEFCDDAGESRLEIEHNLCLHDGLKTSVTTAVTLEALLCGHEEGVTSVVWHPNPKLLYCTDQILISSSTDRTILLWSETPVDDATASKYGGIWTPLSRVGSAGGILGGSIGSTLLGFSSISVEPIRGQTLVGHAYGGSLHVWDIHESDARQESDVVQWKASPSITGHFAGITDCCWEAANGDYLLTVSNDQTCRLWAQLKPNLVAEASSKSTWLELARPQVHGYNLSSVASVSTPQHPHLIVTGADEKEIRAFDAPKTTLRLLDSFSNVCHNDSEAALERVERAYIPSLGLSNKASPADAATEDEENENETQPTIRLPLERDLGAVSLWPEVQKLFGHNTEIYCLSASSGTSDDSTLVASTSKARDADDAKICLWNVHTGQCKQVLSGGHRSTVATMNFSSNGNYLASSGKDRRLCVWKKYQSRDDTNEASTFKLIWALDSAHKRIVWSVDFCPHESQMLASASRDGCIKLWSIQDEQTESEKAINVSEMVHFSPSFQRNGKPDAVTAISFAPLPLSDRAVLAVGVEAGRIELWCISYEKKDGLVSNGTPYHLSCIDPSICHCSTVTKLTWRPITIQADAELHNSCIINENTTTATTLALASCSTDHGCRIFEIDFPKLISVS
jgi:elongator complex protein 2